MSTATAQRHPAPLPQGFLDEVWAGVAEPESNPLYHIRHKWIAPNFPIGTTRMRRVLVNYFSWGIPGPEALAAIAALNRPIVEIGAGTGYWARLLAARGLDVCCYDVHPISLSKNDFHVDVLDDEPAGSLPPLQAHYPVRLGDPLDAAAHPGAALLLCWPPYQDPMAAQALQAFRGDTLIFVGEDSYGCTGDEVFHAMLEEGGPWRCEQTVDIPTFPMIHDELRIYRRRSR